MNINNANLEGKYASALAYPVQQISCSQVNRRLQPLPGDLWFMSKTAKGKQRYYFMLDGLASTLGAGGGGGGTSDRILQGSA